MNKIILSLGFVCLFHSPFVRAQNTTPAGSGATPGGAPAAADTAQNPSTPSCANPGSEHKSPCPPPPCPPDPAPPTSCSGVNAFDADSGDAMRNLPDLELFRKTGGGGLVFERFSHTRIRTGATLAGPFGNDGTWTHSFHYLFQKMMCLAARKERLPN